MNTWILILTVFSHQQSVITQVPFKTQVACQAAEAKFVALSIQLLKNNMDVAYDPVCVYTGAE